MAEKADLPYAPPSVPFRWSPRWRWLQVLVLSVFALSWLTGGGDNTLTPGMNLGLKIFEGVLGLASAWLAIRAARLAVIADADQLIVRNIFRTVQISWQDIARFEPPPPFGGWKRGLRIHLTNGRVITASAYAPTSWDHGRPGKTAVLELELLRRQQSGDFTPGG